MGLGLGLGLNFNIHTRHSGDITDPLFFGYEGPQHELQMGAALLASNNEEPGDAVTLISQFPVMFPHSLLRGYRFFKVCDNEAILD
jgi:hypothetical protein